MRRTGERDRGESPRDGLFDARHGHRRGVPEGARRPGDWWIVDEPEIHLGRNVLVPDLAGWRRSRPPAIPPTAFFTLAGARRPGRSAPRLSPSSAPVRVAATDSLPEHAGWNGLHFSYLPGSFTRNS